MRNRRLSYLLGLLLATVGAFWGQARGELFQTSTIDALIQGVYDGDMTFAELRKHGDFGIGTFNGIDGEMIAFDGRYYQITSDGKARPVRDEMRTPFASVTTFSTDIAIPVAVRVTLEELEQRIDRALPSPNWYYAVRVTGRFESVRARSVPRQQPPYRSLTEVVKTQPMFDSRDVEGVLAGFRCPEFAKGVNVPGYHLHFLNREANAGGHVSGLVLTSGKIEIAILREIHISLPSTASFGRANLTVDRTGEVKAVEK
jgi:acetolactate decarboxylase